MYLSSVIISESEFQRNRASSAGAIYALSSTIRIKRSQFSYNGLVGNGGAIYTRSSNITVNGSVFIYNSAHGSGGAIYYYYTSCCSRILYVINTTFIGNRAIYNGYSGGAIYAAGQSIITQLLQ